MAKATQTAQPYDAQAEVNALVEKGLKALDEFRHLHQEQVDYMVA